MPQLQLYKKRRSNNSSVVVIYSHQHELPVQHLQHQQYLKRNAHLTSPLPVVATLKANCTLGVSPYSKWNACAAYSIKGDGVDRGAIRILNLNFKLIWLMST